MARGQRPGVLRVHVNTVSGVVVVDARVSDSGSFVGTVSPVQVGFGLGKFDDHAVEVLTRVLDPDTLRY